MVLNEYGSITPENAAKIEYLHPLENQYAFSDFDTIVNFAIKNNKRIHGTTLIWHDVCNLNWLLNFKGDSIAWENMFKSHIQTVVKYYKGKVRPWDVVNEAFHDDSTL